MKESELERIFVREVQKAGGRAYKFVSPGNDGVPDRIIIFPGGAVYFVELKADRGRLRKLQKRQIEALQSLGQWAGVVRGIGGVIEFFREAGFTGTADRLEKKYGEGGDADEVHTT